MKETVVMKSYGQVLPEATGLHAQTATKVNFICLVSRYSDQGSIQSLELVGVAIWVTQYLHLGTYLFHT